MQPLEIERLYERGEILRALLRAGQFAHLSEGEIGASLDELWDTKRRVAWVNNDPDVAKYAERAVTLGLVKAASTGIIQPRYFDAQVIDWISFTQPMLCVLCLSTAKVYRGISDIHLGFVSYLCPTFLELKGVPQFVRRPFCGPCSWAIAGRLKAVGKWHRDHASADDEMLWAAILAQLVGYREVRERIRENAPNVARLRFDPRREPPDLPDREARPVCSKPRDSAGQFAHPI